VRAEQTSRVVIENANLIGMSVTEEVTDDDIRIADCECSICVLDDIIHTLE